MTLDCGCGTQPRGDVNIDLVINRGASHFIRSDAQHLPFRTGIFERSNCSTVLEHTEKPYMARGELFRVTNGEVTIKYDRFFNIYNWIGVGHRHLMVRERFVSLPQPVFVFLRRLFQFRPIKFLARRGNLFRADTYEKTYRV